MAKDQNERMMHSYAKIWAVLVVLVVLGLGVFGTLAGRIFHLTTEWNEYVQAIGGGLIASITVFVFISLLLEPRRDQVRSMTISKYAIETANRQFQDYFEAALPSASYESSAEPKSDFREAFVKFLSNSSRYDYKGDSANVTMARLVLLKNRPEVKDIERVRLCLLDPRATEPLRAHAEYRLQRTGVEPTASAVAAEQESLQVDIWVSLVGLFDIRHTRPTAIYLHRDLPFFRCEYFDDGMFLSYYVGTAFFPETLEFHSRSRPFDAYQRALELSRRFATKVAVFAPNGPSADLVSDDKSMTAMLSDLGCTDTLVNLRTLAQERVERQKGRLKKAGMSPDDLF
ncbi:hypothetical protein [Kribbella sp. CA-294648]|uniref:hypothetical protein n=1 Tax=Kribbella sp. CA-294648 TaxID=3239948 RepID=UPI003D94B4AD